MILLQNGYLINDEMILFLQEKIMLMILNNFRWEVNFIMIKLDSLIKKRFL